MGNIYCPDLSSKFLKKNEEGVITAITYVLNNGKSTFDFTIPEESVASVKWAQEHTELTDQQIADTVLLYYRDHISGRCGKGYAIPNWYWSL